MDNSLLFQKILENWPIWAICAVSIFLLSYIYFLSGDKCCFYKNHPSCEKREKGRNHWSEQNNEIEIKEDKCKYKNSDKVTVLSVIGIIIFIIYFINFVNELEISNNIPHKSTIAITLVYYTMLIYFGFFMEGGMDGKKSRDKFWGYGMAAIVSLFAFIGMFVFINLIYLIWSMFTNSNYVLIYPKFENWMLIKKIVTYGHICIPLSAFFMFVYFITYYYTYYNYSETNIEKSKNLRNINTIITSFISFMIIYTMLMLSGLDDETFYEKLMDAKDNLAFPIGTFIIGTILYAIYNFFTCIPILNNPDNKGTTKYKECFNKPLQSFYWLILILNIAGVSLYKFKVIKTLDLFLYYVVVIGISVGMISYYNT
jgi:hypothetical protein